jgi:UDP:flavonoid glycosyltransferase YjiC (YdhE family)
MAKIALFTFDGGGNQPPLIGLALELQRRGHEAHVIGYESQRFAFDSVGLDFTGLPRSGTYDKSQAGGSDAMAEMLRAVMCNAAHFTEVPELTAGHDAAVIDSLLLAALSAAEHCGIPVIPLFHTAAASFLSVPARVPMLAAVNELRVRNRLPAVATLLDWS